ncbi:MAG: hypothetical protein ABWX87_13900, partial [Pseudoxanthomonas sp.]
AAVIADLTGIEGNTAKGAIRLLLRSGWTTSRRPFVGDLRPTLHCTKSTGMLRRNITPATFQRKPIIQTPRRRQAPRIQHLCGSLPPHKSKPDRSLPLSGFLFAKNSFFAPTARAASA